MTQRKETPSLPEAAIAMPMFRTMEFQMQEHLSSTVHVICFIWVGFTGYMVDNHTGNRTGCAAQVLGLLYRDHGLPCHAAAGRPSSQHWLEGSGRILQGAALPHLTSP